MAESCSARRTKLQRAQSLLNELIRTNEAAARLETQLEAQGLSETEVETTLNKLLDGCGPPVESGGDLSECTGDTVSDRLVNLLNSAVTGGVDWSAETA